MRALREVIGPADDEAVWKTFLLDAVHQTPLPDYLLYGEPYPACNAVVLTAQEHRQLVQVTEQFAVIFHKATSAIARDPAALQRLGFPWIAVPLLQNEPEDQPLLIGRFDFLLHRSGRWQLLEYNADTPSGVRETARIEPLIEHTLHPFLPGGLAGLAGSAPELTRRLTQAFQAALADAAPPGRRPLLGLVTDAGYSEDLAQTAFLAGLLGSDVLYGDIDNLSLSRGRLCLLGRPLDALYRYYPFEAMLGRQAFADLFEAVTRGKLRLLNGLRGLLAQNKGLLAWIWAHRDDATCFTAAECAVILHHLPPTRWLSELSDYPDAAHRAQLVLKQVFGREGEEVYFADHLSPRDWHCCVGWGSYIVQQRITTEPLRAVVRASSGPQVESFWPCVGSFAIAHRWAGYYTRLGAPITTARAKYVATLFVC